MDQFWFSSSGGAIDRLQYGYDADGNVLYEDNIVSDTHSELFSYDGLNRLTTFDTGELNSEDTGMSSTTESESWSLDALGNWNSETTDGTPTDQTIDSQNQITAKGSDSYSYDYNGNLTQDYDDARDGTTTTEYIYDAWNRLVYINVDDGDDAVGYTNISYSADGDDAISQTQICTGDTETTTNSYYDLASRVIETDVTSSGSGSGSGCSSGCSSGSGPTTLVSQYVWGLGYVNDLLERDDQAGSDGTGVSYGIASGGTTRRLYALTDANYDVVAIANHSGGVVERFQYDPYGAQSVLTPGFSSTTDSFSWNVGFQGGVSLNLPEITTTTLIQFDNRIYNTALGRWMQQDPGGYIDGPDMYVLDMANPLVYVDPTGLNAHSINLGAAFADIAGKIWNAPNTAIGLVIGFAGVPFGAKVTVGNNAIQFQNHPVMNGGLTLGNVQLYGGKLPHGATYGPNTVIQQAGKNTTVGQHEQQHTYQGQMTGPFYLPLNLIGGILGYLQNPNSGDPWHNPANFMESGPQQNPPVPFPGMQHMGPAPS